jgi:nitroreductase
MTASSNSINELIRSRRSSFVDQFAKGKKIPDEIIFDILDNANHAPTHKLTEPWRFIIFTGKGLQTLAEKQAEIYQREAGEKFKQSKYEKLLVTPQQCSHVIAIVMKRHEEVPEIEEISAVACAVENIYLSLAAYDIGGYWSTGGITYMKGAKEWLGLHQNDRLLGFFSLGYIATSSPYRKPGVIEEKIKWVKE